MTAPHGSPDVEVAREVAAPAEEVWRLVSDVTRVGEWSPETTGARWLGGATGPAVGASFAGTNRQGWHRWSTRCTVTASEPARRFAFHVRYLGVVPVADWEYEMTATPEGCRVVERWWDRRPAYFKPLGTLGTGVADRLSHNRSGMETTLARLAAAAEAVRS